MVAASTREQGHLEPCVFVPKSTHHSSVAGFKFAWQLMELLTAAKVR